MADLLAAAAAVSTRAAETAAAGDVEAALRLEREAEALRRQARLSARRAAPPAASVGAGTIRDMTIAALNELEVPSAPKALSDYGRIRFDSFLNYRALTSLRRDEQRAWNSRSHRPVYVVPALEGRRFLAVRGKLALSSWPLAQRLIGPWSERVDHLRATLNLASQYEWLAGQDPERAARPRHCSGITGKRSPALGLRTRPSPILIGSVARPRQSWANWNPRTRTGAPKPPPAPTGSGRNSNCSALGRRRP